MAIAKTCLINGRKISLKKANNSTKIIIESTCQKINVKTHTKRTKVFGRQTVSTVGFSQWNHEKKAFLICQRLENQRRKCVK